MKRQIRPPSENAGAGKRSAPISQLSVVYRHIKDLQLDPKNPRLHAERQIQQIASSIKTFGFNVPVLIGRQGRVIAGHGRLLGARRLGLKQVPTITLDHLSQTQIRAFMVADNRLTENSAWDERLLAEQFKALSEVELDFNLEVTGFEMSEIDLLIEGLVPAADGKHDEADELPEPGVEVAQTGDLWELGPHRVLCGDARDIHSYTALMAGRTATAVFTDPPYNVPIDGFAAGFGKTHYQEFAMGVGEMGEAEFTAFLTQIFKPLVRYSVKGSLHFVCMDWRHIEEILAAAKRLYTEFKALCVWVKDSGGQGSQYRSQHELVFVFKSGKAKHRNNIQLGQFGRYRTNVWQYPRVNGLGREGKEGNLAALHPTVKPVALVADAILDCTARNDIVLDPFLGSGTTVIAAEQTGRVCHGLEIDPRYIDTIIRRWQSFTGKEAVHAASGRTFNEMEKKTHE